MILNYTLGLSIFAALLIGAYSQAVSHQIRVSGKTANISIARLNADSGIELGKSLLASGATRNVAGSSFRMGFAVGRVRVHIENEAGKIDLNAAPLSMVAAGLNLADASRTTQQKILSEMTRMRASGQQFSSTDQLHRLVGAATIAQEAIPRIFTVQSGNRFVTLKYAHPRLRKLLLERQSRFPDWTGNATSGANTLIAVGYASDGTVYFQSALLKPRPLLNSGFDIVSVKQLPGSWVVTEDDPQASALNL